MNAVHDSLNQQATNDWRLIHKADRKTDSKATQRDASRDPY